MLETYSYFTSVEREEKLQSYAHTTMDPFELYIQRLYSPAISAFPSPVSHTLYLFYLDYVSSFHCCTSRKIYCGDTASFFRCSINVSSDTSSVNINPPLPLYCASSELWFRDGFSLANKNRA